MKISILSIGYELLKGDVIDTNSAWMAEQLHSQGLTLQEIRICDDEIDAIISSTRDLLAKSDAVIVSGGIGPTTDDLTREALAALAEKTLVLKEGELQKIKEIFSTRKRPWVETNAKQALFPEGASVIENPCGTAPGFDLKLHLAGKERRVFALPGVPRELQVMFQSSVLPALLQHSAGISSATEVLLRIFGLPESLIGSKVEACNLDPAIRVSYRATFPEIRLGLKLDSSSAQHNTHKLDSALRVVRKALGEEYIFSEKSSIGMAERIQLLLTEREQTLAVAESCTGGMLGTLLTEVSGSSKYFLGGVISYSNELKRSLLGIDQEVLLKHGAVSSEVAKLMASAARQVSGSDFALSISGVAGPQGGSTQKPVGTFFVGLASVAGTETFDLFYPSARDMVRRYAAFSAMDILRRHILKGCDVSLSS